MVYLILNLNLSLSYLTSLLLPLSFPLSFPFFISTLAALLNQQIKSRLNNKNKKEQGSKHSVIPECKKWIAVYPQNQNVLNSSPTDVMYQTLASNSATRHLWVIFGLTQESTVINMR